MEVERSDATLLLVVSELEVKSTWSEHASGLVSSWLVMFLQVSEVRCRPQNHVGIQLLFSPEWR